MKPLYARHRLDIAPADLFAALAMLPASDHELAAEEVEQLWSAGASGLACYSVRSGFHLLLSALDLPPGSEVLFSAITHPDMPRLAHHHGLVPVPVDLDPATLAPHPEALPRAIGNRSRVLVVAHLFGGHVDLNPIAGLCRRHGILLVEDCAQAFDGPRDTGDPLADVSMFSFGILKTSTALGGAMLTVRDPGFLARMRRLQRRWPVQRRSAHLKRIVQASVFVGLARPVPYTLMAAGVRALHADLDRFVNSAARAFPAGSTDELVSRLERRPSAPLLKLIARRLNRFDHGRLAARAAAGERLASLLPAGLHVGVSGLNHTHWLFPVTAGRPDDVIASARAEGFDAARSASSVNAVPAPASRPELDPTCARDIMSRLVFLPAYPELPSGALEALADAAR